MKERLGPRMPLAALKTFRDDEGQEKNIEKEKQLDGVGTSVPIDQPVLSPAVAAVLNDESQFVEIPVLLVDPSPYQPRIKFAPEDIDALAATIQTEGPLVPISVRKKVNGRYELVAGERRLRAHQILGKETIQAIILDGLSELDAAVAAVADNEARVELCDYERGKAFRRLLDMPRSDGEPRLTQVSLAARIGRSEATISRCLTFFNLPSEVLALLEQQPDLIGGKNAMILVGLAKRGHEELVVKAVRRIKEEGMSEQGAVNWAQSEASRMAKVPVIPVQLNIKGRHIADIVTEGSKVIISCKNGFTPTELMELINKLEEEGGI